MTVTERSEQEISTEFGIEWEDLGITFLGAQEVDTSAPTQMPLAVSSAGFAPRVQEGQAVVNYNLAPDVDGDGAYVMASWRPGGQSRGYRDGLFKSVSNANPGGAFELVARLSYLSVRGADGARRSGHSAALGGNWNIGRDWRLQAQVSSSPDDDAGPIHGLRMHYRF